MPVEIKDGVQDWYGLFERMVEALEIIAESYEDDGGDDDEPELRIV